MFKHNRPLAVAIAGVSLLTSAAACADDAALTRWAAQRDADAAVRRSV